VCAAGPIITLVAFLIAFGLRLSGTGLKAERRWYEARAAAETIKSSCWQFATCGEAFPKGDGDARTRLIDSLGKVLHALPHLATPVSSDAEYTITADMTQTRNSSRANRTAVYLKHRVNDQLKWYSDNATNNRKLSKTWNIITLGLEAAAVLLGVLRVATDFHIDWLGILAAIAASATAWQQTKNYASLGEAYSVTSHDVQLVKDSVPTAANEKDWARVVHEAEAAFSREHTMWLARKQGPR
jgi:hypothetical protein